MSFGVFFLQIIKVIYTHIELLKTISMKTNGGRGSIYNLTTQRQIINILTYFFPIVALCLFYFT